MSDGGKGDTQRPTDWGKFSANFDLIFGKTSKPESQEKSKDATPQHQSKDQGVPQG